MTATKYTYSIQDDFPNHIVATDRLTLEITASAIVTALDCINTSGDDCDIWFKAALSEGDETILDGLVSTHTGVSLPDGASPVNVVNSNLSIVGAVAPVLPSGRRCDQYTPNFCDKTTWYQDSLRVENETMVDFGDHKNFVLVAPCYIADLKSGKLFGENEWVGTFGEVVKVDASTKTRNSPETTDGDYSIDCASGEVSFNSSLVGTEVVTMSYSKVQTSLHKIRAPEGQTLRIGYVEVQMTKDIGLKDTLMFQMWGLADVFAPGQLPEGTMIPISGVETYKTFHDFICDAEKAYPLIPKLTGSGDSWRHSQDEIILMRFDYTSRAATDVVSAYGMEIRVWLENDIPYDGNYAVGTFYGVREDS